MRWLKWRLSSGGVVALIWIAVGQASSVRCVAGVCLDGDGRSCGSFGFFGDACCADVDLRCGWMDELS
jgi:hypothetical protein